MSKKETQLRQGDVFLEKISALPAGVKKKDNVLAFGETTGHSHKFPDQKCAQVYADESSNQFVEVTEKTMLVHDEHTNHTVEPGIYKVTIQREFDLVEGVRKVSD